MIRTSRIAPGSNWVLFPCAAFQLLLGSIILIKTKNQSTGSGLEMKNKKKKTRTGKGPSRAHTDMISMLI